MLLSTSYCLSEVKRIVVLVLWVVGFVQANLSPGLLVDSLEATANPAFW